MFPNLVNEHFLSAIVDDNPGPVKRVGPHYAMHKTGDLATGYNFASYKSVDQERHKNLLSTAVDLSHDGDSFILYAQSGVIHTITNTIPAILFLNASQPDSQFIVNISKIYWNDKEREKLSSFMRYVLDKYNVNYSFVSNKDKMLLINDFYYFGEFDLKLRSDERFIKQIRESILQDVQKSHYEKVYISRLKSMRDIRINGEEDLEKYLEDLGFFIFYPEDYDTMFDQLSIFTNAKIILSATSSGIGNAILAAPGSLLIELVTPFMFPDKDNNDLSMLHQLYSALAFTLGFSYIGIPNRTMNAIDIIDYFDTNPKIKSLLS